MPEQIGVPPLHELVNGSFLDIEPYINNLSFIQLLILGARPLHQSPRDNDEVRNFEEVARKRLSELEENQRKRVLDDIIIKLYQNADLFNHSVIVTDYFEKYRFLVSDVVIPPDAVRSLTRGLTPKRSLEVTDAIIQYKVLLEKHLQGMPLTPQEISKLEHLKQTPVNLVYYRQPYPHQESSEREPYLIISKTKGFERIAGKIPYAMIRNYRNRLGMAVEGPEFKNHLRLGAGVISDYLGITVVTHTFEGLGAVKAHLFTSEDIELLMNDQHEKEEDYYHRAVPYTAIHLYAIWNPKGSGKSVVFKKPNIDAVEMILMEAPYSLSANFGPENYLDRTNRQKEGLVTKALDETNGGLMVLPFTPAELQWKQMVTDRIMRILTYSNRQQ